MNNEEIYKDVIGELKRTGDIIRDRISKKHTLVGMQWLIQYNHLVSNSHSCPKKGVMNWGGIADIPHGYPGWVGRLWLKYEKECSSFGSGPVEGSGIHIGTGGYGNYNSPWASGVLYSWDARFYNEDFPKLERLFDIAKATQIVHHEQIRVPQHKYLWEI
jgi:hypothetical protein